METPYNAKMNSSNYKFTHANGVDHAEEGGQARRGHRRRAKAAAEGAGQGRREEEVEGLLLIDFSEDPTVAVVLRDGGEVIRRRQNLRRDRVA